MKIIISPTKTQQHINSEYLNERKLLFLNSHNNILSMLKKLSKSDIKNIMKIDNKMLENAYNNILNYHKLPTSHAFTTYNGLVFKGLDKDLYRESEYRYIEEHLRILDAFYGVVEPGTLIKPYRLDMKMNIGVNLYKYWDVTPYFKDELIINLASSEFSKMVKGCNLINISFLQKKNDKFINQATYSKQARGKFLNYLILNQIVSTNLMKNFSVDGYIFNTELSNESDLVFTRVI